MRCDRCDSSFHAETVCLGVNQASIDVLLGDLSMSVVLAGVVGGLAQVQLRRQELRSNSC